jgi:pimeloyl-ACP methyl ester carboxylesterase
MPIDQNIFFSKSKLVGGRDLPVVLIHGAGGFHLFWPSEIRRLAGFRIYAVDLPGHGKSGGHSLHSIEAYAGRIIQWLRGIGLHRAVFIGHSMGGAIVLKIALNDADCVLGLGLISTGARLRVSQDIIRMSSTPQEFSNAISLIMANSFSSSADPRLIELAQMRISNIRPSVLHSDFIACNNFDMMDSLTKITASTIVICGEDDQMTPLRYSQYLADSIPDAVLNVIPDSGHMVMLEKPKEVAQLIEGFLLDIPYSPGRISPVK